MKTPLKIRWLVFPFLALFPLSETAAMDVYVAVGRPGSELIANLNNRYIPRSDGAIHNYFQDQGLIAVVSAAFDDDFTTGWDPNLYYTISAAAGVYGSDTSRGFVQIQGVEPMADAAASYNGTYSWGAAVAKAHVTVQHRVIVNAMNGPLPPGLAHLIYDVPVKLAYKLSLHGCDPKDQGSKAMSFARFHWIKPDDPNNSYQYVVLDQCGEELAGDLAVKVAATTEQQTNIYTITAWAEAFANGTGASAQSPRTVTTQAIADPYLYIEPEYAQYFIVQQESLEHSGEWIEVSRDWQTGGSFADTIPDVFTFNDLGDVALQTKVTSNAVTITGINAETWISVSGGEYSIGCTATFTTEAAVVNNGDQVCVRHVSAGDYGKTTDTILNVGGISDTFTSTTVADSSVAPVGSSQESGSSSSKSGAIDWLLLAVGLAGLKKRTREWSSIKSTKH